MNTNLFSPNLQLTEHIISKMLTISISDILAFKNIINVTPSRKFIQGFKNLYIGIARLDILFDFNGTLLRLSGTVLCVLHCDISTIHR